MLMTVPVDAMAAMFSGKFEVGEKVVDKVTGTEATVEGVPPYAAGLHAFSRDPTCHSDQSPVALLC